MNSQRVSVVINTYNRCASLAVTLAALRRQNYPDFEAIVVNGPSTDGTTALLESHRNRVRAGRCAQRNLSVSRNVGITMAAGDLVAFLDDDAVPHENWLADAVAAFDRPDIAGVGGFVYDHTGYQWQYQYSFADRLGRGIFNVCEPVGEQLCYPGTSVYPYLQGTNAIFRLNALREVGGFDEEFDYYLDETDLCLRLIEAGYQLRQISGAVVYHRFLPSHIRKGNRVVTELRPIIKNKIYFALQNNTENIAYRALIDEWKRSTDESEAGLRYHLAEGNITEDVLDRFHADADAALREGLARGLQGPRRLIDSEAAHKQRGETSTDCPDGEGPTFRPYPILLPEAEKLTVCYLSQQYPPGVIGGIGRLTYDIASGLASVGHNVHVLTRSTSRFNTVDFEEGVWVHRLALDQQEALAPEGVTVPKEAWQCSARLLRELRRIHQATPIDLVEGPIWDVEGLAAALDGCFPVITNLETPMKMVVQTNPELVDNSLEGQRRYQEYYAAETLLMQRSTALRAISCAIVETMRKCYGIEFAPGQVSVFPLGMEDRSQHDTFPVKKNGFIDVLFAGRFEGRKGIDVLLQVIPALCAKFPKLRFILVGEDRKRSDGPTHAEAFREEHKRAPFLSRVVFAGAVSDEELESSLAQCDIFVSPSRYESFGLVFLEAMMFGKPSVGCRIGGMQEVIADGITGLLAEPGDVTSLHEALEALISDPELRKKMGRAGRERYLQHFTREIFTARTLEFYRKILDRRGEDHSCSSLHQTASR